MTGIVTAVNVERDPQGRSVVTWAVEGDCDRVDVAWGTTPDVMAHRLVFSADAASGSARLDDIGVPRRYVSVSPAGGGGGVVAAERNLGLSGPRNFRDLGGYVTAAGARTRWGQVFRSDALVLDDADFDTFANLGIRVVYDLRRPAERELTPNRMPDGPYAVEVISLIADDAVAPSLDATTTDGETFLARLYVEMLERSAPSFGRILAGMADVSRLPLVFHCAAGKDRTGMVAAVLLSLLGVDEEQVLDDYELTSRYQTSVNVDEAIARMKQDMGVPAELVAGILRTPRWAMRSALSEISGRYGGIEGYALGPAQVPPDALQALRKLLLH